MHINVIIEKLSSSSKEDRKIRWTKKKIENRESAEAGLSPNISIITFNINVYIQKLKIQNR